MSAQKWLSSLIFPVIIVIAYLLLLSDGSASFMALTHIAGVACGIVPLVLTIIHKADLSEHTQARIKYALISAVSIPLAALSPAISIVVCIGLLIQELYSLDNQYLPFQHTLIIALSNPTFLAVCFIADGFRDWESSGFHL